jgi:hypothetical protein
MNYGYSDEQKCSDFWVFFFLNDNEEIFISHNQKTQTFTSLKLMADPKDYFEDIA